MRASIFFFLSLIIFANATEAQYLKLGVKAGPNLTKVRNDYTHMYDPGVNFQVGGFGVWKLPVKNNNIAIRSEIEVSKNFSIDNDSLNIRYDYWLASMPLYLSFSEGDSPYRLNLGVKLSKLLSGEVNYKEDKPAETFEYSPLMIAVSIGLDYTYNERWAIQFSYDFGKTDFFESRENDLLFANSLQVSVNYTLFKKSIPGSE